MLSKIEQLAVELAREILQTGPREVLKIKLPPEVIEPLQDLISIPETLPQNQVQEEKPYWEKGIPYQSPLTNKNQ